MHQHRFRQVENRAAPVEESTNAIEHVSAELDRRASVVGIFPIIGRQLRRTSIGLPPVRQGLTCDRSGACCLVLHARLLWPVGQ